MHQRPAKFTWSTAPHERESLPRIPPIHRLLLASRVALTSVFRSSARVDRLAAYGGTPELWSGSWNDFVPQVIP